MKTQNDGGPAFPLASEIQAGLQSGSFGILYNNMGMSLRDWFAGMALQGMFANSSLIDTFSHHKMIADEAFNVADDMLAARERKEDA